jgi:hypothetical protein
VRQRQFPQRQHQRGRLPGLVRESVRGTHTKQKRQRITILVVSQKSCQFLGRELLSSLVEQYQHMPYRTRIARAQLQKSSFVFERDPFDVGVTRQTFQILICQRLDGCFFRLTDPGNFEFHRWDLSTCGHETTQARFFFKARTGARFRPANSSDGSSRRADFHKRSRS